MHSFKIERPNSTTSTYTTRKSTRNGKRATLARAQARQIKYSV